MSGCWRWGSERPRNWTWAATSARWEAREEGRLNMATPGAPQGEIRQLARYQVRPGSVASCLAAIHEFVAYVRAHEPGTLRYEVWQEAKDPTRFTHIFVFRD